MKKLISLLLLLTVSTWFFYPSKILIGLLLVLLTGLIIAATVVPLADFLLTSAIKFTKLAMQKEYRQKATVK
jgi:hypothetical protein